MPVRARLACKAMNQSYRQGERLDKKREYDPLSRIVNRSPSHRIFLDRVWKRYHSVQYLPSDPLEFVHRFKDPWDQEAVALGAALLSYGNVTQIRRSVEALLGSMSRAGSIGPAAWVRSLETTSGLAEGGRDLQGFVHRFNTGEDLVILYRLLARSWATRGSLGAHFLEGLAPADGDIGPALSTLIRDWRAFASGWPVRAGFHYLLTSPEDGSCCKRWCMFLRWMGRRDELDPGLWAEGGPFGLAGRWVRPSQLVIPLDTHTGRISQYVGLTQRKTVDWKAALEVTRSLGAFDPLDPVKYDFALARLGILDLCQKRYRAEICEKCDLRPACSFARAGARRSARAERRR